MNDEKKFLVSKQQILSEVARNAVASSPYHRPDNLEVVLDKLNEGLREWSRKNCGETDWYKGLLGYKEFTYKKLKNFLEEELKKIPEFLLWNERKNGNQAPFRFTSRYSKDDNPDDDFIDLDALIRNVANDIIRSGTEMSIPKILGEAEVTSGDVSTNP